MYDPQAETKVFILGFSGSEIYYSTSERRIISDLSTNLEKRRCLEREQLINEDSSDHESG